MTKSYPSDKNRQEKTLAYAKEAIDSKIYIHVLNIFYVFTKGPEIMVLPRAQKSLNPPLRIGSKIVNS